MKAYKGFDKDLKCRDFQYEVGKEYETEDAILCDASFHACENPLDTLNYYRPGDSRYCEVDLDATEERGDDTKRVGKRIKIETEIGLKGMIEAGVKFVFDKCEGATEQAASGRSGNAAASGENGNASTKNGVAAAIGFTVKPRAMVWAVTLFWLTGVLKRESGTCTELKLGRSMVKPSRPVFGTP